MEKIPPISQRYPIEDILKHMKGPYQAYWFDGDTLMASLVNVVDGELWHYHSVNGKVSKKDYDTYVAFQEFIVPQKIY